MHKEGAANDPVAAANMASAADKINQIREILFGGDRRAIELRLANLEDRLRESEQALRSAIDDAVQALRTQASDQVNELLAALASERETRVRLGEDLSAQIGQLRQTLDEGLNRFDADLSNGLLLARSRLQEQVQDLAARVSEEQTEIARRGAQADQRLQDEKVGVQALSQLFDALAAQLRGAPTAGPGA